MLNKIYIFIKPSITLFIIFFSYSLQAKVSQDDLQSAFAAGSYTKMAYDCEWIGYEEFYKIIDNFDLFAIKKYRNKSDQITLREYFTDSHDKDFKKLCKKANKKTINSYNSLMKNYLNKKFW